MSLSPQAWDSGDLEARSGGRRKELLRVAAHARVVEGPTSWTRGIPSLAQGPPLLEACRGGRMIACVGIIGQANNPLFIQSFTEADDLLKFHFIVHCSLDVIDERVSAPRRGGANDTYLSLLYPTEDLKVYGYVSNTQIKFIAVVDGPTLRETDIRTFFKRLHAAYVDVTWNPFHIPGKRISSPAFLERVASLVATTNGGM